MKIEIKSLRALSQRELVQTSGGDRFTRAIFSYFGSMCAVIANAMDSDRQHGVHGHI